MAKFGKKVKGLALKAKDFKLSNENGDRCKITTFGFVVYCVHGLFELFEASKYSQNLPSMVQR